MQHDADFITAHFLYIIRASCAHHQEYKILTRQPPVQVVMAAGGSSLRHTSVFLFNLSKRLSYLGPRWRWVLTCKPWRPHTQYPLNRRLSGRLGHSLLRAPRNETRTVQPLA